MTAGLDELHIGAHLADLKQTDHRHALAIASLVDVLVHKGVIDPAELARRSAELDRASEPRPRLRARPRPAPR